LVDVLEEPDSFVFDPEDGGSIFLHGVSTYLPNCMTHLSIYFAVRRSYLLQMLMFAGYCLLVSCSFLF
jgi:hypothetical protein